MVILVITKGVMKMKVEKNKSKKDEKVSPDAQQFVPRKPDYRGNKVAVWLNERKGYRWLRIKIAGIDKDFAAFENIQKRGE
jgi:hypothetical protein